MLVVDSIRVKDGETFVINGNEEITGNRALELLFECELAFGTNIVDISPTWITARTIVMDCVDTMNLSGTVEEMEPLVKLATFYATIKGKMTLNSNIKEMYNNLLNNKELPSVMIPQYVNMLNGVSFSKAAALAYLDLGIDEKLMKLDTKELSSLLSLKMFDNATNDELLSLVA